MSRRVIIDEIEVDVPYGRLHAKTYHEETDESKRILALHGWMDNAGSFDHVMPHIKHENGIYVVCIELPGHGRSSQYPPGATYSDMAMLMEVRRWVKELKWHQPAPGSGNGSNSTGSEQESHRKFSIIGHSWGGGLAALYASLWPEDIDELVCIDFFKSKTYDRAKLLKDTAEAVDGFLETVPSMSPEPSPTSQRKILTSAHERVRVVDKGNIIVSQETAIIGTIEGHNPMGSISREDAICLLKRSTVPISSPPNMVLYNRDLRLKHMLIFREHIELNKLLFGGVKCHILFILGRDGLFRQDEFTDNMETMIECYKESTKGIHIQWMKGDHYVHMTYPKEIANVINEYLAAPEKYKVHEDI